LTDRFWLIHAEGYTTKPVLTDLSFGYTDAEWNAGGNIISESRLKARRWNSSLNTWSDYPPSGNADVANNHVNIFSLPAKDLFEWWTLVDPNYPLNAEQKQSSGVSERIELISKPPSIRIYPNPFIQSLTIDLGGNVAREFQIIDVNGRKLHQQLIAGNIQTINLSFLPSGTYFLQLNKNDIKWIYKMVKE
jgi:hypothetical protein